ncbi:ATP-binding protein [Streptomyces sp. NRRL S-337]|uniref:ATP-binding protein n=1 Tax=Streptomyces sp. NRRL S-337 TaxID=1463900 RepID=UPI00068C7890|nr:tetratricopeptide repeat protein [Streptomyces sp. NRRL S-337]
MSDGAGHSNTFGGSASAHGVVQARDVHGGVHLHQYVPDAPAIVPHQLLGGTRHFVNRSRELSRLGQLVADGRGTPAVLPLAVITGTAGVGKTSLALHWAHTIRSHYPGGELYANLRGYAVDSPVSPERILGRFLEDLGVPAALVPVEGERRESMFRSLIADRRMLVILDNAVDSGQVRPLLPGSAACLTVVTSRDDLSGLVAQQGALRVRLETFPAAEAITLLRTATAEYRGRDRRADLAELARLCARLPLALRIAAERAASWPSMPLSELIEDLRDESALWNVLTTTEEKGGPDAMRSVFEWSYRALPAPAARLFRILGLHPGNEFGLPAVAGMAGVEPAEARAQLDTLVSAHLLERRPAGRYEFHDLLRAYAADQARKRDGEAERRAILERCLAWYLHTADAAQSVIAPFDRYHLDDRFPAPDAPLRFARYEEAFQWYRTESGNLATAVRVAAESGFPALAWRLAVVLRAVYMHHNAFDDWASTARIAVDAAVRADEPAGQAEALESLGKSAFQALRLDEARDCHRSALAIRRQLGDRRGTAVSVNALGLLGLRLRRLHEARAHFEDSCAIFRELRDRRWTALLQGNLAESLCELGRYDEAVRTLEPALAEFRVLGDRGSEGNALFLLCWARRGADDAEAAGHAIEAALAIAGAEDNQVWRGHWLMESARLELARGNPEVSLCLCRESALIQRRLGDRAREAIAQDGAGEACQALGRHQEAAELHRRAVALHRGLDGRWQLACALHNLADALHVLGEREQARAAGQESRELLSAFDDPQAAARSRRLAQLLERG